jgi:NTP pyrophosphatase (non-canonical NTP hydrolase)
MHREQDILNWAQERGIFEPVHGSNRHLQAKKTQEELDELREAIQMENISLAMDAIGDIVVTLVIQARMWNLSFDECVESAWQEIKDRKGKMIDGLFVKESIDDATPEEWDAVSRKKL